MFSCGQIGCKVKLGGKIMSKTINLLYHIREKMKAKLMPSKNLWREKDTILEIAL